MYELRENGKTVAYIKSISEAKTVAKDFSESMGNAVQIYNESGVMICEVKS